MYWLFKEEKTKIQVNKVICMNNNAMGQMKKVPNIRVILFLENYCELPVHAQLTKLTSLVYDLHNKYQLSLTYEFELRSKRFHDTFKVPSDSVKEGMD